MKSIYDLAKETYEDKKKYFIYWNVREDGESADTLEEILQAKERNHDSTCEEEAQDSSSVFMIREETSECFGKFLQIYEIELIDFDGIKMENGKVIINDE